MKVNCDGPVLNTPDFFELISENRSEIPVLPQMREFMKDRSFKFYRLKIIELRLKNYLVG